MILTLAEFIDATAFEYTAIGMIYPLVNLQDPRATLDLDRNTIQIHVHAIVGTGARDELVQALRPLIFGAAWKILDLMIEYGLSRTGRSKPKWQIEEKRTQAIAAAVPPLNADTAVWARLAALYSGTTEARHCLVHREFELTPSGDMTRMRDRKGSAIPDVTVSEQSAFCRAVQRASVAVRSGRFDARDRLDLIGWLDELTIQHGCPRLGGGAAAQLPPVIRITATRHDPHWTVNVGRAHAEARRRWPGLSYYDVEIRFPDSGLAPLRGRLEDAPETSDVSVDPADPPHWIDP